MILFLILFQTSSFFNDHYEVFHKLFGFSEYIKLLCLKTSSKIWLKFEEHLTAWCSS